MIPAGEGPEDHRVQGVAADKRLPGCGQPGGQHRPGPPPFSSAAPQSRDQTATRTTRTPDGDVLGAVAGSLSPVFARCAMREPKILCSCARAQVFWDRASRENGRQNQVPRDQARSRLSRPCPGQRTCAVVQSQVRWSVPGPRRLLRCVRSVLRPTWTIGSPRWSEAGWLGPDLDIPFAGSGETAVSLFAKKIKKGKKDAETERRYSPGTRGTSPVAPMPAPMRSAFTGQACMEQTWREK